MAARALCNLASVCRAFNRLVVNQHLMQSYSAHFWPRLTRQISLRHGSRARIDWCEIVSTQLRFHTWLSDEGESRWEPAITGSDDRPLFGVGGRRSPVLTKVGWHASEADWTHSEWVTSSRFFPGSLPITQPRDSGTFRAAEAPAMERDPAEKPDGFCQSRLRGAFGGQTGLVSCSYDGTVRFWDLTQVGQPCVGVFKAPGQRDIGSHLFSCLQYNQKGNLIVVGDIHDDAIIRWELTTGKALQPIMAPIGLKECIDLNHRMMIVGCSDGVLRMFTNEQSAIQLGEFYGHRAAETISCVRLLGVGEGVESTHVLSASGDATMRLWDLETSTSVLELRGHTREIFCADTDTAVSPMGGDLIISGGRDRTARLWDRRSGKCEHVLTGHSGTVVSLRFDDMVLATAGGYARGTHRCLG